MHRCGRVRVQKAGLQTAGRLGSTGQEARGHQEINLIHFASLPWPRSAILGNVGLHLKCSVAFCPGTVLGFRTQT